MPWVKTINRGADDRYLARDLGESTVVAAKTDSVLGERYRCIAKRCGKKRAIVAVGRSILVIVWQLLFDEQAPVHRSRRRALHLPYQLRDQETQPHSPTGGACLPQRLIMPHDRVGPAVEDASCDGRAGRCDRRVVVLGAPNRRARTPAVGPRRLPRVTKAT